MRSLSLQPEIFKDRGGFVELGHFKKHFKNSKKAPCRLNVDDSNTCFHSFIYNPKSGCGTSVNLSNGYPKLLGSSKSSNVTFL